ncbi:MAG: hypothetical protein PHQ28_09810 [Mycobacterium sp.]|nr:hypothetical protein [Mycobacterium sp.]
MPESGDDVLDVGADTPGRPVVIVADDAAGVVAAGPVIDVMPRWPPSPRMIRCAPVSRCVTVAVVAPG